MVVESAGHAQVVVRLEGEGEPGEVLRADDVDVERFGAAVRAGDGEAEGDGGLVEAGAAAGLCGEGSGEEDVVQCRR